jgi:myo-inositol-1-phosphate synthase
MGKIQVVVAGVGNCCSALLQSIIFHKDNDVGLIHKNVGGMRPSDIEIIGAVDIDSRKVGRDLSEAILAQPNVALKVCDVPHLGIKVIKGPILDGADGVLKDLIKVDDSTEENISKYLHDVGAEILVNLLPTGCQKASEFYADAAIHGGCAFINCTQSKIASDNRWIEAFEDKNLPLVGDDLMSQIGGTALHMGLLEFLSRRGVKVDKTYQLDIGGSMEAYGVLEDFRREEKRKVKSETIKQVLPAESKIATGTSDYVSFMKDRRTSYFYIEGRNTLGTDVIADIYLRTYDGSNGAGMLLDILRGVKLALNRRVGGQLTSISAYGFKNPPIHTSLTEAQRWFEEFISGSRKR